MALTKTKPISGTPVSQGKRRTPRSWPCSHSRSRCSAHRQHQHVGGVAVQAAQQHAQPQRRVATARRSSARRRPPRCRARCRARMPLTASSQKARKPIAPRWRSGFRREPNAASKPRSTRAPGAQAALPERRWGEAAHDAPCARAAGRAIRAAGRSTHAEEEQGAADDLEDQLVVVAVLAGLGVVDGAQDAHALDQRRQRRGSAAGGASQQQLAQRLAELVGAQAVAVDLGVDAAVGVDHGDAQHMVEAGRRGHVAEAEGARQRLDARRAAGSGIPSCGSRCAAGAANARIASGESKGWLKPMLTTLNWCSPEHAVQPLHRFVAARASASGRPGSSRCR